MEQRDGEGLVSKENEAGTRKGRGAPSEPICAGGDVQVVVLAEWGDGNATNVEQRRMGGWSARKTKRLGGGGEERRTRVSLNMGLMALATRRRFHAGRRGVTRCSVWEDGVVGGATSAAREMGE